MFRPVPGIFAMKHTETFTATIYAGLLDTDTDINGCIDRVYQLCQEFVDEVGLCVTVSPTRFIYSHGWEDGVAVGLINYPRFPSSKKKIKEHALTIARKLKKEFKQKRLSIVFPGETIMLEEHE